MSSHVRLRRPSPLIATALLVLSGNAFAVDGQGGMQGMDHSQMQGMDHSQMQGMDHSQMQGMDHSQMQGMDHPQMQGM
ncbi:copper resistance protein CopB, partial [Pseudomonas oryzihabitans]